MSKIFIGHVRYASCGGVLLQNTHPFSRSFRRREVVFAHNGTLSRQLLPFGLKFRPIGETDSEYAFCALLTELSEEGIKFTDFARIEAILRAFNRGGSMNVLFSEGVHLYCYRDQGGYNGLCVAERVAPFPSVALRDEDWEVDLAEEKSPAQRGFVIATRPLTDENWQELAPGSLYVFKEGQCIYGG